ncbi:MAG: prephenate dehydrogenase, partial [Treponema sp.]|nr:prephenate dehydrogenase [Treponema sp.]
MKPIEDCVVGIVGLGLMGGAVALALRPLKPVSILALDTDRVTLEAARADGIIDDGVLAGTFRGGEKDEQTAALLGRCDLVFLCINPSALIRFVNTRMDAFR